MCGTGIHLGAKLGWGVINTSPKCSESSVNPHPSLLMGLQIVLLGRDMEGKTGKKKGIKKEIQMELKLFHGFE